MLVSCMAFIGDGCLSPLMGQMWILILLATILTCGLHLGWAFLSVGGAEVDLDSSDKHDWDLIFVIA